MAKMVWKGEDTYRGADEFVNASMTVAPGEEIEVSEAKALQLDAVPGWERVGGMPPAVAEPTVEQKPEPEPEAEVDEETEERNAGGRGRRKKGTE